MTLPTAKPRTLDARHDEADYQPCDFCAGTLPTSDAPCGMCGGYVDQDLRPLLRESISQARRKREQGAVRVYVAGASNPAELGRAELCMNEMRRLLGPDVITHDWIRDIKEAPCADFDLSDPACARYATNDVDAVEAADVIWLVVPSGPSTGAWVELGVALGLRRAAARKQLIVASGPDVRRSIFTRLCDELHEKDSDARDSITRFAAHRAAATGR